LYRRAALAASPELHTATMAVVFAYPDPITNPFAPDMFDFHPLPVHHVIPFPEKEKSDVF
jgi:hypothetical protein